eukprot:6348559-Heterocapsa_arctica.AAC.1
MHWASNEAGQIFALHICGEAAVGKSAREGDAQLPQGTMRIFPGGTTFVWASERKRTIVGLERLPILDLEPITNN